MAGLGGVGRVVRGGSRSGAVGCLWLLLMWRRKRTGRGRGLGEVEDWGRKRTGGGRGLGEEEDWGR